MKYRQFLKGKNVTGAMFMGIFYAVAMLGIFLPGYSAIPGKVDELPIAIVNEDSGEYGSGIASELKESLPFKHIKTEMTDKQALKDLEKNELALVIHIPESFSADLQKGEGPSKIDFTVNEASATTVSSTMTSVVAKINDQLSTQFSTQTAQGVLMNLNVPEHAAAELAQKIETAYAGNVVTINEIPAGMNNNMLPMFLTMAGYTGAMIGAMQLVGAYRANRKKASKTRLFIYVQLTALLIAVVSSVIGVGIAYAINHTSGSLFLGIAGQQILNYFVCFNFTAILVFLVGEGGMVLNLPILLIQTLANGATLARDMMYLPYKWMSHISPMYYSVQGYFANLYGSISPAPYLWTLTAIGAVALLINIVIVLFHKPIAAEVEVAGMEMEEERTPAEVLV